VASNTPNIGLYKKDPVADGNDTFNIQTMMNDNWDKIDTEIAKKENSSNKGQPNGYAALDPAGKVPAAQVPDVNWVNITDKPTNFTPSAHKSTHAVGGTDPITPADLGAETPANAQIKANNAEANAKSYAMNSIAVGSTADPNTTQESYILTNHANSPGLGSFWHIQTYFYSNKTGNRSQVAVRYNGGYDEMYIRSMYINVWTSWKRVWHEGNTPQTRINNGQLEYLDGGSWKSVGGKRPTKGGYVIGSLNPEGDGFIWYKMVEINGSGVIYEVGGVQPNTFEFRLTVDGVVSVFKANEEISLEIEFNSKVTLESRYIAGNFSYIRLDGHIDYGLF